MRASKTFGTAAGHTIRASTRCASRDEVRQYGKRVVAVMVEPSGGAPTDLFVARADLAGFLAAEVAGAAAFAVLTQTPQDRIAEAMAAGITPKASMPPGVGLND